MILIAAAAATLMGLSELPPQAQAAPGRCRVFLWARTERPIRIAMIDEAAQTMRLNRGRQMMDIAQFAPGQYGGHGYLIAVTLEFAQTGSIQNGALVSSGSMRIEQLAGGEAMVVPVGGMRACG